MMIAAVTQESRGAREGEGRREEEGCGLKYSGIAERDVRDCLAKHPVGVLVLVWSAVTEFRGKSSREALRRERVAESGEVEVATVAHECLDAKVASAAGASATWRSRQ